MSRHDPATGIVSLRHRHRFLDKGTERMATSRIRFIGRDHLARLIGEAGLTMRACYGDWERRAFTPQAREIIAVVERKG